MGIPRVRFEHLSPSVGFGLVVVSIFVTESLVMLVYSLLGIENDRVTDFVDAFIVTAVVGAVSYFVIVRPLMVSKEKTRLSERRLRAIFDSSTIGIALADKDCQINETNRAFQQMLGLAEEDLVGLPIDAIIHQNDLGCSTCIIHDLTTEKKQRAHLERRYLHKDGHAVWCREHVSVVREHDEILFFCIMAEDISLIHEAEYEKRLAATLFQTSTEAMVISDADNAILRVNPAFTRITGYSIDEAIGKNPKVLASGHHTVQFYQALWEDLLREDHWNGDLWNRHKDGHLYAQRVAMSVVRDSYGEITNFTAVFSDVTDEKRKNDEIRHQAHYDALTGLANRSLMWERLLFYFSRGPEEGLALLFIDLDGFKPVNDRYGHPVGDRLLQIVAERLKKTVRHSDTVARIGGDEFVVIVHERESRMVARKIAENILGNLRNVMRIDEHEIRIGASIGVAVYPEDGETPDELVKAADGAMYRAKLAGRNTVCFHS